MLYDRLHHLFQPTHIIVGRQTLVKEELQLLKNGGNPGGDSKTARLLKGGPSEPARLYITAGMEHICAG